MAFKVFVDGREGTTGLQIIDYLSSRKDIELLEIDADLRKDPGERQQLINQSDVTFLCLPDTASRESASLVTNSDTCIIDASTAFRTHPDWVYGLPEIAPEQRDLLRKSKKIANPGCHATAFVLGVHPLIKAGIMPPDYPACCYSITGYSGGGKKLITAYEQSHTPSLDSPRHYALGLIHKHLPEMMVRTGLTAEPVFTPVVADFYKGLAVTTFLHTRLLTKKTTPADIRQLLARYYQDEPFIQVFPFDDETNLDNGFFDVQGCNHTNRADIFVFGNDERMAVITRIDNLGKGASGAAVQCMNIHLGLDETTGLA
ncbi:MAG: N-acetyl-gamma-glutamyl-phosphate reductase [Desulfotignum sp.]|nr:N-acetyl-gamma-glutamyl-phosphate reductase [Desulfotignum sp.]MCF8138120.1 N-acetyl-gamma-glutamyl-phosphate reductase [Desulfotignum sp.]